MKSLHTTMIVAACFLLLIAAAGAEDIHVHVDASVPGDPAFAVVEEPGAEPLGQGEDVLAVGNVDEDLLEPVAPAPTPAFSELGSHPESIQSLSVGNGAGTTRRQHGDLVDAKEISR